MKMSPTPSRQKVATSLLGPVSGRKAFFTRIDTHDQCFCTYRDMLATFQELNASFFNRSLVGPKEQGQSGSRQFPGERRKFHVIVCDRLT